jgi:hypothetical protein
MLGYRTACFKLPARYVSEPETKSKCTKGTDKRWYCERLKSTIETPKRSFILTCRAKDHTGSQLVTMFGGQVAQLLGHAAGEFFNMHMSGQHTRV